MQTQKSFIKTTMLDIEIVNEICLGIFFLRKGFTAQWPGGRAAAAPLRKNFRRQMVRLSAIFST